MKFKNAKYLVTVLYGIGIALIFASGMLIENAAAKRWALIVAIVFAIAGFIVNFNWGKCPYCGRVIKTNMFTNLYTQKCPYCGEKPFITPEEKARMEAKKKEKAEK